MFQFPVRMKKMILIPIVCLFVKECIVSTTYYNYFRCLNFWNYGYRHTVLNSLMKYDYTVLGSWVHNVCTLFIKRKHFWYYFILYNEQLNKLLRIRYKLANKNLQSIL